MSIQASAAACRVSAGVFGRAPATVAASRCITSVSTASRTEMNSAVLSGNWWYMAPRVTPAASAISGVETAP